MGNTSGQRKVNEKHSGKKPAWEKPAGKRPSGLKAGGEKTGGKRPRTIHSLGWAVFGGFRTFSEIQNAFGEKVFMVLKVLNM